MTLTAMLGKLQGIGYSALGNAPSAMIIADCLKNLPVKLIKLYRPNGIEIVFWNALSATQAFEIASIMRGDEYGIYIDEDVVYFWWKP
jgi:hypothetical protein